jgi:hypothetical protein
MRWWLNTDHKAFSIDNAVVKDIDCSSLDPTIWMVQWQDGRGEIEHQIDADTNDNGLRDNFVDVIPYAPFFKQFLEKCPGLTLSQAKKVNIDLIKQVFESKRQLPFHYPVAAGDYSWDATDDTLISSTVAAIQNVTASLNATMAALNAVVAHINSNIVGIINQNAGYGNILTGQINTAIVNGVNAEIVNGVNTAINTYNTAIAVYNAMGDALVLYINDTLGTFGALGNTVNWGLKQVGSFPDSFAQGLTVEVPHTTQSWANPYTATGIAGIGGVNPGTFNNASAISYTPLPSVSVANAQWIPIGGTTPVTVTPAEQAGIMNGIAARTSALNVKKNIKIGQVNALPTTSDVIAYDVTTGWCVG